MKLGKYYYSVWACFGKFPAQMDVKQIAAYTSKAEAEAHAKKLKSGHSTKVYRENV